jgi:hypothetical protein
MKAKYMIIYRCPVCDTDSGCTENDKPNCRYCKNITNLELVSKEEINREVLMKRLQQLSSNVLKNLQSAYESMNEEDNAAFPREDAEQQLFVLLAKAKKFRDEIRHVQMKNSEEYPE